MDLEELESFVAVARMGSFTRAAKERHLTQPGVSRHVQRLERELGTVLLERHKGSIEPTAAGNRLLTYAQDAIDRNLRFLAELHNESFALSGELRVAASTTPGEFLVPNWVAGFTKLHAEVQSQVFVADSAEVISELRERRWDIGFVGTRIFDRALLYEEIAEDEVVLAVPPTHSFANRNEVSLEELEDQPFLEREGGSGTLSSFRGALSYRGLALPQYRVVMVLSSTQAILSAVRSGYGMGLVSILAFEHTNRGEVIPVRLKELPRSRPLYMVRDESRALSPVANAFADWVKKKTKRNDLNTTLN